MSSLRSFAAMNTQQQYGAGPPSMPGAGPGMPGTGPSGMHGAGPPGMPSMPQPGVMGSAPGIPGGLPGMPAMNPPGMPGAAPGMMGPGMPGVPGVAPPGMPGFPQGAGMPPGGRQPQPQPQQRLDPNMMPSAVRRLNYRCGRALCHCRFQVEVMEIDSAQAGQFPTGASA